ncbi:MAG: response regulator [Labilithrix sp.]|nr:response regulator [Labilithrix sp.]
MAGDPDFRILFEQSPDVLVVLLPDAPRFTMVAATDARLAATHTTRAGTIGKGLFEVFPDNPEEAGATGANNLRASLERVLATRTADTMAVQKYDIRGPDGTFETKHWSPKNLPVLSPSGEVLYILHRVEDVTDLVRASELGEELRDRNRDMEREVIARSRELHQANRQLRETNVKLGELDVAKTAFFSNISHEFRTPLTLMLGPLEDALADQQEPLGPRLRTSLGLVHDNALRLLKLVNALLDFSRIEAGRMTARFAPLDLGRVTAEGAGMFQSATDKAGMSLVVDCPPSSEPAFVDRDMWEKIVTNLVSNAFKFTLAGTISVRCREEGSAFVVEVADTGVGIPESELPYVFDRFHRVPGATSRTHEGTGIGLALVRELVGLHGGEVSVTSEVGVGTTFRVELPKGHAHLAPEAVSLTPMTAEGRSDAMAARDAEAQRWLAPTSERLPVVAPPVDAAAETPRARILVVDDNADLRTYIAGILSPKYDVRTANDGRAALDTLPSWRPDMVISDVMMPVLDGFGLLRELRADPSTASLPVILLSARAGEEAAVEGLDAGSDDYLVKPFSARELLARVRTHLELEKTRRAWAADLERANRELEAFSYSVSHDLRAPLRAVDGFAHALVEDYADVLDAAGKDCVERIRKGASRMGELIESLLELSRITMAPLRAESVLLSELATSVVEELRRAHPGRTVDVGVEAGLATRGDRRLLNVVLVNLIGNAWKFTSKVAVARIDFGRLVTSEPTFFVRDNGAGFDPTYAQRLFAPFQRLHDANEFEGTGVGLATVQRAISRHGGRIWAESAAGKGATFLFTLPDRRGASS